MSPIKGWVCWESPTNAYEIGIDNQARSDHGRSGYVFSKDSSGHFGSLMQKINAAGYRGKRIRFSGSMACQGVDGSCALFMEVFSKDGEMLAIDNMSKRNMHGRTDWRPVEIVLDIPADAFGINFGARLIGNGKLWVAHLRFEEVGLDTDTTDEIDDCPYAVEPQNLSFGW